MSDHPIKSAAHDAAEKFTRDGRPADGVVYRAVLPDSRSSSYFTSFGFQGVGMTALGYQVVMTSYFEPMIRMGAITGWRDNAPRYIYALRGGEAIAWTELGCLAKKGQSQQEKVRLFPGIMPGSGAARAQTVMMDAGGTLWLTRNGETDRFYRLVKTESGSWRHIEPVILQGRHTGCYIEAASMRSDHIAVIRSRQDGTPAWMESYGFNGRFIPGAADEGPRTPWLYGLTFRAGDPEPWTVIDTTTRKATVPRGIYRGTKLVRR